MTYPHTMNTKRLEVDGLQEAFVARLSNAPCFLQPMGDKESAEINETFSQPHKCLVPLGQDVKSGDQATILGDEFTVRGVKPFQFGGKPHQRLLLERLG